VEGEAVTADLSANCPDAKKHTRCPKDYVAWRVWAEAKSETHRQEKCPTCGLYVIWKKNHRSAATGNSDA
jgi:hypothetical protein